MWTEYETKQYVIHKNIIKLIIIIIIIIIIIMIIIIIAAVGL
jgi:hypothetical protein